MAYDFDWFVIGAGSGGIASARRAASYGARVAVAESDRLGGTCVNRGCVPKKLLAYASRFPKYGRASAGYGWDIPPGALNWQHMITAVNDEVTRLNGVYQRLVDTAGVTLFRGHAQLLNAHTLKVGEQSISAERILIAVGGKPVKPNIPGIDYALVSDAMFQLPAQPKRIVIVGGGYIGCEFACIMHGLGTEVIQVIRKERILNGFDEDLRSELQTAMVQQGITLHCKAQVVGIENTYSGVTVTLDNGDEHIIVADAVSLAATGRRPNVDGLGLENTVVAVSDTGAIATNPHHQTAEPNIYAIGDCTDRINLPPVAINEGRILADTLFGDRPRTMDYNNIPSAIFTTPEAATVGLSEQAAIAQYGEENIQVFRTRFRSMYYTLAGTDDKTLMKLVVHRPSDKVLGAHMVGDQAAEIIQGMAIALKMGATKADFDATVGIHPSAAEEFVTLR